MNFFFVEGKIHLNSHNYFIYMVVVLNYIVYIFVGDTEIQLKMR